MLFIGSGFMSFFYSQGILLHIALKSSCLFDSFYTNNIVGNPQLVTLRLLSSGEQSERDELCVTDDAHAAEKLGPIAPGFFFFLGGFKLGMTYSMLRIRQVCK